MPVLKLSLLGKWAHNRYIGLIHIVVSKVLISECPFYFYLRVKSNCAGVNMMWVLTLRFKA